MDFGIEEIRESFEDFVRKDIPKMGYGEDHNLVVVEVFSMVYRPSGLIGSIDAPDATKTEYVFPVGKVLQAGVDTGYKAGDIVRLRDNEVRTYVNPRYEMWINNEYSKSNIANHQVGSAPPKYIQGLFTGVLGRKGFITNPFKLDDKGLIFAMDIGNILMPIRDWEVFFK